MRKKVKMVIAKIIAITLKLLLVACIGICTHLIIYNYLQINNQIKEMEIERQEAKEFKERISVTFRDLYQRTDITYEELRRIERKLERALVRKL